MSCWCPECERSHSRGQQTLPQAETGPPAMLLGAGDPPALTAHPHGRRETPRAAPSPAPPHSAPLTGTVSGGWWGAEQRSGVRDPLHIRMAGRAVGAPVGHPRCRHFQAPQSSPHTRAASPARDARRCSNRQRKARVPAPARGPWAVGLRVGEASRGPAGSRLTPLPASWAA